jgi:hypothetical protein
MCVPVYVTVSARPPGSVIVARFAAGVRECGRLTVAIRDRGQHPAAVNFSVWDL